MKIINLDSLYSDYWLYDLIYGCKPYARSQEAMLISDSVESVRDVLFPKESRSLRVLEMFAGWHSMQSSIAAYNPRFKTNVSYDTVDSIAGATTHKAFDAYVRFTETERKFFTDNWYDLVLMPFYAVNATGPIYGGKTSQVPSYQELTTLFENAATICGSDRPKRQRSKDNKHSCLYLKYESYPTPETLTDLLSDADDWYSVYLPPRARLLEEYGIKDTKDSTWVLEYREVPTWIRETATLETRFPDGIRLINKDRSDKPIMVFQFRQPIYRRYWSEDQLARALYAAGFSNLNFNSGRNLPTVGGEYDFLMYQLNNQETTETAGINSDAGEFLPSNYLTALL